MKVDPDSNICQLNQESVVYPWQDQTRGISAETPPDRRRDDQKQLISVGAEVANEAR
jgi:hypothetical protein